MENSKMHVVLVTGSTDGLGKALALALAQRGVSVLVHGRDQSRIDHTIEALQRAAPNAAVRGYRADFSALAEVRALAEQVNANERHLDILVNNAGIGSEVPGGPSRQESRDGYELRFAVNYLATYLLSELLLPRLLMNRPARIVNVSSIGQQAIDFDDVMLTRGYSGSRAYRQSKLAQILSTIDLAERVGDAGVSVTALHPATYMPTKIVSAPLHSIEEGVEATLRAILDPTLEGVTGRFFNGQREQRADPQAYDPEARRKLRELSERWTSA